MISPELLLLDEPCAGLDMGARERLLSRLGALAQDRTAPPIVMVTHHVEEIPVAFSHVLLLRGGRVLTTGPLDQALSGPALSECFGVPLTLQSRDGRWTSQARRGP
jgi:iron complex transport system ATP-binding protein